MLHKNWKTLLALLPALVFFLFFGSLLLLYVRPMEDVSLNLSLGFTEDNVAFDSEHYDQKGWTVYTQDGEERTELESVGFGGFTGLELGETFYFSRVLVEELDTPTLQIGAVEQTFSVWLDDTLTYTDCPELDNRIGYLTLPMNEWLRMEPITISLPLNYQGKTLTITQSFPEYSETGSVKAYPTSITLYCGYAYESGLISESFGVAILASFAFLMGTLLLIFFVRSRDAGLLALALVAFLFMTSELIDTSFFWEYFGAFDNSPFAALPLFSACALLFFLTVRAGKYKSVLWVMFGIALLSVLFSTAVLFVVPAFSYGDMLLFFITYVLPKWILFVSFLTALLLGTIFWRKESRFYRGFLLLSATGIAVFVVLAMVFSETIRAWENLLANLKNGRIDYPFYKLLPVITAAALITAVVEMIRNEIRLHTEKHLLEERRELALSTYENMRRQHEEIMMLRHDMAGHLEALKQMIHEEQPLAYLNDLIGQNQNIRTVIQTGNEMLDIILGGKLASATDAGIQVEVIRANAPKKLPLSDTDLCSLVINILNNAITAAENSGADTPFLKLDVHTKDSWIAIVCENSADMNRIKKEQKKETVPGHGLGLKIMENIARKYTGLVDTEYGANCYKVRAIFPLNQSAI